MGSKYTEESVSTAHNVDRRPLRNVYPLPTVDRRPLNGFEFLQPHYSPTGTNYQENLISTLWDNISKQTLNNRTNTKFLKSD